MKKWIIWTWIFGANCAFAQTNDHKTLLPVRVDKKWGYIDTAGNMLIDPLYDRASHFTTSGEKHVARVVKNNRAYVIDKNGHELYDPGINDFKLINDSVFLFYSGGLWGLFNFKSEIGTNPIFFSIQVADTENACYLVRNTLGYGLLGNNFKTILPCGYQAIKLRQNFIEIKRNGKQGLMDRQGHILIDAEHDQVAVLSSRYCWVRDSTCSSVMNLRTLEYVLDTTGIMKALDESYALLYTDSLKNLWTVDFQTHRIIKVPYQRMDTITGLSGVYRVDSNDLTGVWSPGRGEILPTRFTGLRWSEPYFEAMSGGTWDLYSAEGKRMTKLGYDRFLFNENGIFTFKNYMVGFLNYRAEELIPTVFRSIWWNNQVYKCKRGSGIAVLYEIEDGKVRDRMMVEGIMANRYQSSGGSGWGSEVVPVTPLRSEGWFRDNESGLWGLRRPDGRIAISPRYNDVRTIHESGYAITEKHYQIPLAANQLTVSANSFKGYGVVDEANFRQVCSPIFLYVDERTLASPEIHVIRVRRSDGMFTTVNKHSGRVASYALAYMDTFSNNRALALMHGNLASGHLRNIANYPSVLGDDNALYARWGLKLTGYPAYRSDRVWYTKNGNWNYLDENGDFLKVRTQNTKDENRVHPLQVTAGGEFENGYAPVEFKGQWYLMDSSGYFCDTVYYHSLERLKEMEHTHYLAISRECRQGVLDLNGNVIHEIGFRSVRTFNDGVAWALKKSSWGLLTASGNWIEPTGTVRRVADFSNGYGAFGMGRSWVFTDTNLNIIKPDIGYDIRNTSGFSEGLAAVQVQTGTKQFRYGYMDTTFRLAIEPHFVRAEPFHQGVAKVYINGKYRFINTQGEYITRKSFPRVHTIQNGLIPVMRKGGWGVLTTGGRLVVPNRYLSVSIHGKYIHAFRNRKLVVYHVDSGVLRTITGVNLASGFSDGVHRVVIGKFSGYLNANGTWLAEPKYEIAGDFNNGAALVGNRKETFSISKGLDTLAVVPFRLRGEFNDNTVKYARSVNGELRVSYLNVLFQDITSHHFEDGTDFSYGLAAVRINGKWGMMDTTGKWVVQPVYEAIYSWDENHIKVSAANLKGLISYRGEIVIPLEFDDLEFCRPENVIRAVNGQFFGYMNMNGEWIWRSDLFQSISGN